MEIRTDDDIYRVNSVWLGPPKATMPWHVRYVAWGIGLVVFFGVVAAQRAVGIGFGFFSTAWGVLITIVITRLLSRLISYERPLGAVLALFVSEVRTPRERTVGDGGVFRTRRPVRVRGDRPCPAAPGPVEAGLDVLVEPPAEEEAPARSRRVSLGRAWCWLVLPLWLAGFLTVGVALSAGRGVVWAARRVLAGVRSVHLERPHRVRKPFPMRGEPLARREAGPVIGQYKGGVED